MLGIGMGEMILIGAIALIVIGPEKFPDFAKIALRTVRDLRGYVDDIQNEVTKELKPLKRELDKVTKDSEKYIDKLSKDTNDAFKDAGTSSSSAVKHQADPTDRQDDSFDYGSSGNTTPNKEYTGETVTDQDSSEASSDVSADDSSNNPEGEEPPEPSINTDPPEYDFDTPEPPVERLD